MQGDSCYTARNVVVNWPAVYLTAIRTGKEIVSEPVRAVYERECAWMEKPPDDPEWHYVWNPEKGLRCIFFIEEFCRQSKGALGARLKLALFQKAKLQLVFGWLDRDTGMRRFREVVDVRGRKCGKSTETAAVSLYCLIADAEGGAEIYCCANKIDQAKIIFGEACNMVSQSPDLKALLKKRRGDIYFPDALAKMMPLAADSSTLDGLNTHFFSLDEWHAARTSAVYDVMYQSQYARRQPLAWLISTCGFVRSGFYDEHFSLAYSVAMWMDGFHDYEMLCLIYKLDAREEWTDPAAWGKANPGLGEIKDSKKLAASVERAKRDPTFLPTLLTKDFNLPANSNLGWLTYEAAFNDAAVPMEYLEHSYAIGGCDLSATTDLTCATLLIKKPQDPNYYVLQQYFMPEERLKEIEATTPGKQEAPYRRWAEKGWLTINAGNRVDYRNVTQWFVAMVREHDIRPLWVCYDAALSGYWVPEMEEYGFDMEKIRQGPYTWSYPMKDLGAALAEHKVIYQANPILLWCLMNTAKKSTNKDGIESIQPVKCASNRRIDGMVSLLNAWVGYANHVEEYTIYTQNAVR